MAPPDLLKCAVGLVLFASHCVQKLRRVYEPIGLPYSQSPKTRRVSAVLLFFILSALFSNQEKMDTANKVGAKRKHCIFSGLTDYDVIYNK